MLARFEGAYASTIVTVMGDRSGFEWKDMPTNNKVDEFVAAKLKRTKTLPSEIASDEEFLRRIHLDLTGSRTIRHHHIMSAMPSNKVG